MPFALWHAIVRRDATARVTGLTFLLGLCILCLPARKIAHHLVVLYPVAALFVAPVVGGALRYVFVQVRHALALRRLFAGLAVLAWGLVLAGRPPWVRSQRCLPTSAFAQALAELPPGSPLLLVTPKQQWRNVAALAAELRITAWQIDRWERAAEVVAAPRLAVVVEPAVGAPPPGWRKVGASEPYSLWRRDEPAGDAPVPTVPSASARPSATGGDRSED